MLKKTAYIYNTSTHHLFYYMGSIVSHKANRGRRKYE